LSDLKTAVNADFWKTGKSGNFAAGSNWTLNAPPAPGQEAVIGVAGTYTVSVTSAAAVAAISIGNKGATLSIASGATFSAASGTGIDANLGAVVVHSGATFAAGGIFTNSGTVSAAGGSVILSGGTVGNASAGTIAASGGGVVELIGATILGGALKTAGSGSLIETASGRNSGSIVVAGTDATLLLLDNVSVTGPGKLQGSGTGALIEIGSGTVDAISGGTIASGTLVEYQCQHIKSERRDRRLGRHCRGGERWYRQQRHGIERRHSDRVFGRPRRPDHGSQRRHGGCQLRRRR
jgi:hypothetical protein